MVLLNAVDDIVVPEIAGFPDGSEYVPEPFLAISFLSLYDILSLWSSS
jgi:hypothetical protein